MKASDTVVLISALITLITALVPIGKWAWRKYVVRKFDAKKAHYEELVEQAKWFESRFVRLNTLRDQLLCRQPPDRFKLAEMISKLDRKDATWARTIDDHSILALECERKSEECQRNAEQAREWAGDVARKVLFW